MTKKQSLFFRLAIFFAGLSIIAVAFSMFYNPRELTAEFKYLWINVCLIYLIFFIPFFFSCITIKNFNSKIPTFSLVWLSIILFSLVSILFVFLVYKQKMQIKSASIIQLVFLFFLAIAIYFAYFGSTHVENVSNNEEFLLSKVSEIKSSLALLNLKAKRLGDSEKSCKEKIERLEDSAKYLSPVNSKKAFELEQKIIISIEKINEDYDCVLNGSDAKSLESSCALTEDLLAARKLLRN